MSSWIVTAVVVALLVWAVLIYNRLVRLRNQARTAWADIDVQLTRRHDLVPQLVAAVQGYVGHEKAVLEAVTELRARAVAEKSPARLGEVESALEQAMGRLLALQEAYPDLKASDNFLALQRDLVEVEDHLQYARRFYNGAVRDLNDAVQRVPDLVVARAFAFAPGEFYQADERATRGRVGADSVSRTLRKSSIALCLAAAGAVALAQPGERILEYAIEVAVDAGGALDVTERITVRAEGNQIRRGIYRDFPDTLRGPLRQQRRRRPRGAGRGARRCAGAVVHGRARERRAHQHRQRRLPAALAGRVSVHAALSHDSAARLFRRSRRALLERDRNGLGFRDRTRQRRSAPTRAGARSSAARRRHTRAPQGAQGRGYSASVVAPGVARWELTAPLMPREGLTIVLSFPKGVVAEPTQTERVGWLLADNRGVLVALAGFALLALLRRAPVAAGGSRSPRRGRDRALRAARRTLTRGAQVLEAAPLRHALLHERSIDGGRRRQRADRARGPCAAQRSLAARAYRGRRGGALPVGDGVARKPVP